MRPLRFRPVLVFGCLACVAGLGSAGGGCGSSGGGSSTGDGGSEASCDCSPLPDAGADGTTSTRRDAGGGGGEDATSPVDASAIEDASDAADVGVDASRIFACGGADASTPDGGPLYCDGKTQICFVTVGGPAPGVDEAQCASFPPKCHNNLSCGCVSSQVGGGTCADNGGDFTVTRALPEDAGTD